MNKKCTSPVWHFFEKENQNNTIIIYCKLCKDEPNNKSFAIDYKNNTTPLIRQMEKSHPEDWKKLEESSKLIKKIDQMYIPNNNKETEESFTDKTQELVTKLVGHLI